MKILVTGASGLLGSRFVQLYSDTHELLTPPHSELDITDLSKTQKYINENKPDVILHCAALTLPTPAEAERDDKHGKYWLSNVVGTGNLIKSIDEGKTHFVHISTDMVFSGSKNDPGPYNESHLPETDSKQLPWYGFTKAEAERFVMSTKGLSYSTIRFGKILRSHSGLNFTGRLDYLSKPLKLYDQKELFPLIIDQYISISPVDEACQAINIIIKKHLKGIFHVASPEVITPDSLISYYLNLVRGVDYSEFKHMHLADHPYYKIYPFRFPQFGGFNVERTEKRLGIKFSPWKKVVEQIAATP